MTFVGKILIFAQVVFSLFFMAFAGAVYTTQTNWRTEYNTAVAKQGTLTEELGNVRESLQRTTDELTKKAEDAINRASLAEANSIRQETTIRTHEADIETVRTQFNAAQQAAATAGDEAKARRSEAMAQREINDKLHKQLDERVVQNRELKDKIFNLNRQMASMEAKHNKLLGDVEFLRKVVQSNGLSTDPKSYVDLQPPPPKVDGLILETRDARKTGVSFVTVSIGGDDGLTKGNVLTMFRDREGKYLGKIRLVQVYPDHSVGTIIRSTLNGTVERGDNVTTKL